MLLEVLMMNGLASKRLTVCLIALLTTLMWGVNPSSAQSTDGVGVTLQPPVQAARLYTPNTLGEQFNSTINTINGVIGIAMFFDVAGGAFLQPVTDDDGNLVYEMNPVYHIVDQAMPGYVLNGAGDFKTGPDGKRLIVTLQPGERTQRVDSQGDLITNKGDVREDGPTLPFTVLFLAGGAIFFTFWYGWINIRGFKHAIDIVRGKFTRDDDPGDVSPFRALTSALSATVGLGNIAGVAIAVKTGGPGAIFWMMFLGLFGMTAKFHESTLGQMFRKQNEDGTISGGPMFYLDSGLKRMGPGFGMFGRLLAIIFALFCMGGALGGGNMFQANQSFEGFYSAFVEQPSVAENKLKKLSGDELRLLLTDKQLTTVMTDEQKNANTPLEDVRLGLTEKMMRSLVHPIQVERTLPPEQVKVDAEQRGNLRKNVSYGFGLLMATLVAVVVIGGITRIGAATSKIVPVMCLIYVLGCLIVIVFNLKEIPGHVRLIFIEAFKWDSAFGGFIGVMILGFKRAAFSSEAGLGSSAIAHSAAKQAYPVREGFVASLEPFIDTIIICFMTAMVVLITDAYAAPELMDEVNGTAITLYAFEQTQVGAWFPYVLSVSIILFAFSTMISWCYYGERAYGYLFGHKTVLLFRILFVICVFIGSVASLGPVLDFSDLMILSMAFPNILGGLFLVSMVRRSLREYWSRFKSGEFSHGSGSGDI